MAFINDLTIRINGYIISSPVNFDGMSSIRDEDMKVADDEMIRGALQGDREKIEDLLESLEPLLISSIRRYYYRPKEFEDLMQNGRVKVLECLGDYDSEKGVHFLGYVKVSLMYLYLNKKDNPDLSLDYEDKEGFSLKETLEADEDIEGYILAREEEKLLASGLEDLTDIEREVVWDFYIKGKSLGEIAKDRGSSYRTIVNNKTRALRKLREFLDSKFY